MPDKKAVFIAGLDTMNCVACKRQSKGKEELDLYSLKNNTYSTDLDNTRGR